MCFLLASPNCPTMIQKLCLAWLSEPTSLWCDIHQYTCAPQVALIDWLRQYDIIKKMERMGKSVGMIAGQVRVS